MRRGAVLPVLTVLMAALRLPLAAAEPVAVVERTAGRNVIAELIAVSKGELWIRRLSADRRTETIPLEEVKAIDFGELPIELNAAGAILLDPDKPDDTSRLWWAVDHRQFIVLLRTCRFDTGTAKLVAMLKMEKETEGRLEHKDLPPKRRRDLEIARVVLLFSKGQREEARRELARLRNTYRGDPIRQQFIEELWMLLLQEGRRRRPDDGAPAGPLAPPERPHNSERRDERRAPPTP